MDTEVFMRITEELFECFSYIRSTVEGVLACSNPNVWNVFGGLNRTKKAVLNILINELRSQQKSIRSFEQDPIQELCGELLSKFPCGDIFDEADDSQDALLLWIEHHLLDHSLHRCIKCMFLQQTEQNCLPLQFYKEFSFLKNDVLLGAFLYCLDALQQNSMDQLSNINPLLMNRSTFLLEITPWVSDKMTEEYKIEHNPPDDKPTECASTLRVPSTVAEKLFCETCNKNVLMTETDLLSCGCSLDVDRYHLMRHSSQRSFSQDVLMKSALSAVLTSTEERLGWYDDNEDIDSVDNLRTRLTRMKEISRSESSLFQEGHTHTDTKEAHSDHDTVNHETDKTISSQQEEEANSGMISVASMSLLRSSARVQNKRGHHRSKSDQIGVPADDNVEVDEIDSGLVTSSLTTEVSQTDTSGSYYYHSEDGQLFPKPYKGQSLISYLDSRSYDTGAQLDKENAHFSICEALITAFEQMHCQNVSGNESDDGSDEEIKILKTKIKARRSLRKLEKQKRETSAFSDPSDTGKSSSLKTSSTMSSSFGSSNTDDANRTSDTPTKEERGLSISASWENVSLAASKTRSPGSARKDEFDKVEIIQVEEVLPDDFSAEAVAKNLLKKFHGHSIPAASELKWMVSEQEVPQQLLPLPTAWPVSPDAHLEEGSEYGVAQGLRKISMPSLLRGNLEWAPPRPQIIFSPHPFVKRKVMLQRQHFRCAGCGLNVTPNLSKRFRYCEYIGKYFCTSCHQNKLALIPAKILWKWDFKKYPVSDFAKELLKKIYRDPLFNVLDVSPNLYENIRLLAITKSLRLQLHYVKNFLRSCRHADSSQKEVSKLAMHLADDPHSYSLDDLVQVKNGEMQTLLKPIVTNGIKHIKEECQLCSAKGFVCEYCRDGEDILYPFDLNRVHICQDCKTCYHRQCYVEGKCNRCERIKARQKMIQEQLPELQDG